MISNSRLVISWNRISVLSIVIMTIIAGWGAYQGDTSLSTQSFRNVFVLVLYGLSAVVFFSRIAAKNFTVTWLFVTPLLYWFITHVFAYTEQSLGVLEVVLMISFTVLNRSQWRQAFVCYRWFVVISAVLGIVCYFSFLFNIGLPYRVVPYYSSHAVNVSYIDYGVCYLYSVGLKLRLCGLFNEPGYFGTIIALMLCADKLNLKHKSNYILIVAGCLTFSLAFILIVVSYMVLTCYKKPKLMIPLLLLIVFYFGIMPNIQTENVNIRKLISRLTFTDGQLTGNNRTSTMYDALFDEWLHSDKIFFGYGEGYRRYALIGDTIGSASLKNFLIDYGVIGSIILLGSLAKYALDQARKNPFAIIYIIVFAISLLQRPYPYCLPFFMMLFGGIEYVLSLNESVGEKSENANSN